MIIKGCDKLDCLKKVKKFGQKYLVIGGSNIDIVGLRLNKIINVLLNNALIYH